MDYREPEWVAERLGMDRNTLYRLLQDGTLPALQLGRKWLISEQRLTEWLEQETEKQTRARRDSVTATEAVVRRLEHYTAAARQALRTAHAEARRYAHQELDQGHLLLGLASETKSAAGRVLRRLGIDIKQVRQAIESQLTPAPQPVPRRLPRNAQTKRAMRIASKLAVKQSHKDRTPLPLIGSDHLLLGILLSRHGLGHDLLASAGVSRRTLKQALRSAKPDTETQTQPEVTDVRGE